VGTNVLLAGAGLSRNWGAPLAGEFASSLVQAVGADADLEALLRVHEKDFETALAKLQAAYLASPGDARVKGQLARLQAAIGGLFDDINGAFANDIPFELSNQREFMVSEFLARFDAIANLNQDMLLELGYEPRVLTASGGKLNGAAPPGLTAMLTPGVDPITQKHRYRRTPMAGPFTVPARTQPIFKPHGSSDWVTREAEPLLVIGGDKEYLIAQHEILRWHHDQFAVYLRRAGAKLMVIGYSFSDTHINQVILDAWRGGTLRGMFIVDLAGRSVLDRAPGLKEIPSLGGSTRPFRDTFSGDPIEHAKFIKFFDL